MPTCIPPTENPMPQRPNQSYYNGNRADAREEERTLAMARHFLHVLIDTGFSPENVARAFHTAGEELSRQIDARSHNTPSLPAHLTATDATQNIA